MSNEKFYQYTLHIVTKMNPAEVATSDIVLEAESGSDAYIFNENIMEIDRATAVELTGDFFWECDWDYEDEDDEEE